MQYTLIANSVTPEQVEERTIDGERHLVATDVTFIRPMELAGGYVPEQSVANSAPSWDRQPLTVNHPKNLPDRPWYDPDHDGFYVSANRDEEVRRRKVVGHARDPSRNGDGSVSADLAINVSRAEEIADDLAVANEDAEAASTLLRALRDGDPFDVSSQYFPQPLPPGEYDGEHREQAEAIANADSIALLPGKDGVCSLEDGCGFQPPQATANADVVRAPVANASDDPAGASSSGSDTTDNSPTDADVDLDELPDDLFESGEEGEMASNTLAELGRNVVASLWPTAASTETTGAESPVDAEANSAADDSDPDSDPGFTMERDKLIDEITSNSEIERESLEGMGDTCLQSTHEHVVANADEGGDDEEEDDETTTSDADEEFVTRDELSSVVEEAVQETVGEAVANAQEQSEKAQRVERIIANSTEYDSDDEETLLETPEPVLEDIEAGLSSDTALPGTGAAERATANAAGGDDADDYSDGTIGGDL